MMVMLVTTNIKKEVVAMLRNRRFTLQNVKSTVKFNKIYKHDLGIIFNIN